jgi:hypothetical protein
MHIMEFLTENWPQEEVSLPSEIDDQDAPSEKHPKANQRSVAVAAEFAFGKVDGDSWTWGHFVSLQLQQASSMQLVEAR